MSVIENFIESNYEKASRIQRSFDHDVRMQNMLKQGQLDKDAVKSWMRGYGLFQGISSADRLRIAEVYSDNILHMTEGIDVPNEGDIEKQFHSLLEVFYEVVPRRWTSAVSKLLWCSYPNDVAIYDAFVHRSLVVLQGVTPFMAKMQRLDVAPQIKRKEDISDLVSFYMHYRSMIKAIQDHHQDQLDSLRERCSAPYSYDIRILDKLLWMLGGPGQDFSLGEIECTTKNG